MYSRGITALLFLIIYSGHASACPTSCFCSNKFVDCTTLMEFPNNLPPDTTRIRMSQFNIPSLPSRAFRSMPNITTIELTNSNVANIQACAFAELPAVKTIKIDKTTIGNIERYAFNGLSGLDRIQIDTCRIGRIKPFSFYNIASVSNFELINTHMYNIYSQAFHNVTDIDIMIWTKNNISDFVTGALDHVYGVKKMEMHLNTFWNMHCGVMETLMGSSNTSFIFVENTFYCNCSVSWLLSDVGKTLFSKAVIEKTKCHGPDKQKLKPLNDVTFPELGCKSIIKDTTVPCDGVTKLQPYPKCLRSGGSQAGGHGTDDDDDNDGDAAPKNTSATNFEYFSNNFTMALVLLVARRMCLQ